jgi:acetyl-CoA acetyltransferase
VSIRDKTAIVGLGATDYYKRGQSAPRAMRDLVGEAILKALADAGLTPKDVDGFSYYMGGGYASTDAIAETIGVPEVKFTATLTGGGGGCMGHLGLAAAAIMAGQADVVVCVGAIQQTVARYGQLVTTQVPTPDMPFYTNTGLVGPGHLFSLIARQHMHKFGTTREQFAKVALTFRENALTHPLSIMKKPMTIDDYFNSRMIADPLCLFDFCLETDGAVAVVLTSAERAKDLKQKPVYVSGCAHGGEGRWGRAIGALQMPDDIFPSSGHRSIVERLYNEAGVGPSDIDVALVYDNFSFLVISQLEDYGFCPIGEGGPFVESGAIARDGSLPVNPHGGQLSNSYIVGSTNLREAVEQMRGCAANQVEGAEVALVTGGPASIPVSGLILRN